MRKPPDLNKTLALSGPNSSNYDVGYRKPPIARRFQRGKSGNPLGRPKGSKNRVPEWDEEQFKTIIMEEVYRTVSIIENGRRKGIPLLRLITRSLAMRAAKGNNRAAKIILSIVRTIEDDSMQIKKEHYRKALAYKDKWKPEFDRCEELGLPDPDQYPHPDDVHVNSKTGLVKILGPLNALDVPMWEGIGSMIPQWEKHIKSLERKLKQQRGDLNRRKLIAEISKERKILDGLKMYYGPRTERIVNFKLREFGIRNDE